jgi:hypothetical protein
LPVATRRSIRVESDTWIIRDMQTWG